MELEAGLHSSEFVPKKWPQFLAGAFGSLGGMIIGTATTWPDLAAVGNLTLEGQEELRDMGPADLFWVEAIVYVAAVFTVIPAGWAMDRFGRRTIIMFLCLPTAVGWVVLALAHSMYMVLIGRLIIGIAVGAFSIASPVYVVEVSSRKLRGNLGCQFQNQVVQGFLFVYINGRHFHSWKWLALLSGSMALPILIGMYFMPESPVYFLTQGRDDDAKRALKWLRGAQRLEQIAPELDETRKRLEVGPKTKAVLSGQVWRALIISALLLAASQCGRFIPYFVSTQEVFGAAGIGWSYNACMIAFGAFGAVGVLVASILADKLQSRKALLWASLLLFGASGATLGLLSPWQPTVEVSAATVVQLACLLATAFGFNLGLGPIPWLLLVEHTLPERRGKTGAIPVTLSWLAALVLLIVTRLCSTSENLAHFYWISGLILLLSGLLATSFLRETSRSGSIAISQRL